MVLYLNQPLQHYIFFFFFNDTATTEIYTLSLHDALPISKSIDELFSSIPERFRLREALNIPGPYSETEVIQYFKDRAAENSNRSEEHTSELQSQSNLVCRLLLEKKKPEQHN